MENNKFINNIESALSQVDSQISIVGTVSVAELEKRIQSAIGQLEHVQANIDYLRKSHVATIELNVSSVEETPTQEAIIDAWEQHCRDTRQSLIPVTAVIIQRDHAELRATDGTKLARFDFSTKTFK